MAPHGSDASDSSDPETEDEDEDDDYDEAEDYDFDEEDDGLTIFLKSENAELSYRFKFLDASSHLYKWVCPSVGPSVVRPSAGHAFVKNGKIDDFDRK